MSGGVHTHRKFKTNTHNRDTPLPQQSDQPGGIVHDNTGWHGTWGAGCPQCDSTQGQDASTGFFRCASQSKEQPDSDICQVSVRRFTDWCPTFLLQDCWRQHCHSLCLREGSRWKCGLYSSVFSGFSATKESRAAAPKTQKSICFLKIVKNCEMHRPLYANRGAGIISQLIDQSMDKNKTNVGICSFSLFDIIVNELSYCVGLGQSLLMIK